MFVDGHRSSWRLGGETNLTKGVYMARMSGAQRRAIRAARKREGIALDQGNCKLSTQSRCSQKHCKGGVFWDITVGPEGGRPREFRNATGIGGYDYRDMPGHKARKLGVSTDQYKRFARTLSDDAIANGENWEW